jgi:hypothetical protein
MTPHVPIVYEDAENHWQYKRLDRNLKKEDPPTEEELNELGKQGWELCGMVEIKSLVHFYFKRPSE